MNKAAIAMEYIGLPTVLDSLTVQFRNWPCVSWIDSKLFQNLLTSCTMNVVFCALSDLTLIIIIFVMTMNKAQHWMLDSVGLKSSKQYKPLTLSIVSYVLSVPVSNAFCKSVQHYE